MRYVTISKKYATKPGDRVIEVNDDLFGYPGRVAQFLFYNNDSQPVKCETTDTEIPANSYQTFFQGFENQTDATTYQFLGVNRINLVVIAKVYKTS